jgi:penicillin-binding protein 1A
MVFTPELLCGTWVGCDENWIHYPSSSAEGYGGAAALPNCGLFLKSVYKDKKLAYDPDSKFIKPAVDKNDIIYDYFQNISGPPSPDAEGTDLGNGEANDYYGDENNGNEKPDTPVTKLIGPPAPGDKEKLPDTGKKG